MNPTILVVTVVHWPDDTRIRERLIRTLSTEFEVVYAARSPGPTDRSGIEYVQLTGGRFKRNLIGIRLALTSDFDAMVVHDPELLICAGLTRLVRRKPVVFDVHEDVPASAYTRNWVPRPIRRPLAAFMAMLLRVVEPILTITLAEPGYRRLFNRSHPTFPNFPDTTNYPEPGADLKAPVVYLGDVTTERGADVAVDACSRLSVPLRLIGRVTPEVKADLQSRSTPEGMLEIEGLVPNDVAIRHLSRSSVGLAPLRDLPNYRHSQPTKILEYLAVGLPVVASDLPGTRELVEGLDAVYLVEPGNVEALAEGIEEARSPDVIARANTQAPEIRTHFSWPADEVREFYRSLL